jgi:hypothetical protein
VHYLDGNEDIRLRARARVEALFDILKKSYDELWKNSSHVAKAYDNKVEASMGGR